MQFESQTYFYEVCVLSSACTGFLADLGEATCVMQNDAQYPNCHNNIRSIYLIKPESGYRAFRRSALHEMDKRRKWLLHYSINILSGFCMLWSLGYSTYRRLDAVVLWEGRTEKIGRQDSRWYQTIVLTPEPIWKLP